MAPSILENGITVWTNGMGSIMKLQADNNGNLTGTYETAEGRAQGPMPLCGKYNPDELYPSLAWCVQWKADNIPKCGGWTSTAWSGVLFLDTDNKLKIHATWTLSQQIDPKCPEDVWKSHLCGCGLFVLDRVDPIPAPE